MRISNQNQMPQNANLALGQENKEMERAAGHKSFRLTVTGNPPKVSTDEIRRMLSSARGSNSYKANFHKYQFKLNGQELTLKQQGLFSRFKGMFSIRTEVREARRADAAKLIGDAFEREDKKLGAEEKIFTGQMTNADSIKFQRDVMTHSGVSPKARELRTNQESVAASAIDDNPLAHETEVPITFDSLMAGGLDEPNATGQRKYGVSYEDRDSFEPYNSEIDAPKDSLIQAKHPRALEDRDWLKEEGSLADDWPVASRDSSLLNPLLANSYLNQDRSSIGSMNSENSNPGLFRQLLGDH